MHFCIFVLIRKLLERQNSWSCRKLDHHYISEERKYSVEYYVYQIKCSMLFFYHVLSLFIRRSWNLHWETYQELPRIEGLTVLPFWRNAMKIMTLTKENQVVPEDLIKHLQKWHSLIWCGDVFDTSLWYPT